MADLGGQFEFYKAKLDKALHEKNKVTEFLEKIEQLTGIDRLYIVLGFFAFLVVYMFLGYGAGFICNLACFLYPAYASIKAIESQDKEDDNRWLTYWVVYSFLNLLDYFFYIILFWIPFYWVLKCVFLIWCFFPVPQNGSRQIYVYIIRPIFLQHKDRIDSTLDEAKGAATGAYVSARANIQQTAGQAFDMAKDVISDEINRASNSKLD